MIQDKLEALDPKTSAYKILCHLAFKGCILKPSEIALALGENTAMADHFLSGTNLHLWRDRHWPRQMGVDYRRGVEVQSIEPEAHRIRLKDGRGIKYHRLVIATGSRLHAPVEGSTLPGVHNFKSLSAAEAVVTQVKSGKAKTAVIVGAGFIGMEIALLLRELGVQVIQVEMLDQVMAAMLDRDTATIALDLMRKRGVDVRLNTQARAFVGAGKASGVELASGQVLEADILIAATGVKPNLDLLEGSGIAHGWGIRVDDHLRTSVPDIYAAGDANFHQKDLMKEAADSFHLQKMVLLLKLR